MHNIEQIDEIACLSQHRYVIKSSTLVVINLVCDGTGAKGFCGNIRIPHTQIYVRPVAWDDWRCALSYSIYVKELSEHLSLALRSKTNTHSHMSSSHSTMAPGDFSVIGRYIQQTGVLPSDWYNLMMLKLLLIANFHWSSRTCLLRRRGLPLSIWKRVSLPFENGTSPSIPSPCF